MLLSDEYFATNAFSRNDFQAKTGTFSISYRGYRDCFTTKSFSRKLLCFLRLILRLPNHEKCMFSVLYGRCDSFSKTIYFPCTAFLEPFSTQNHFSLKPFHSQACFLHFQLQGMFSKTFSSLLSQIMQKLSQGFQNWGFFENRLGFMIS